MRTRLVGDVSVALGAQALALVISLVTALLVPKVLSVEQFGFWQLFVFYAGFVGVLHLGLNDGVYLVNGGKSRDSLDSASLASQLLVGMGWQILLVGTCVAAAMGGELGPHRDFVVVGTMVYAILYNASHYLGVTLQAIGETRRYSVSVALARASFAVLLVPLLATRCTDFRAYVAAFLVAQATCLVYCVASSSFLWRSGLLPIRDAFAESRQSIRVGLVLMIANTSGMFILGALRLVVDWRWGISAFGQLSFGLSIVSLFMNMVVQIGMVLFPALRRSSSDVIAKAFRFTSRFILLLGPTAYLAYFPAKALMGIWLPQYGEALEYLALLLPICVFDAQMSVSCATFFKTLRAERMLLLVNSVALLASVVLAGTAVVLLGSVSIAVLAATVTVAARSVASSLIVGARLNERVGRELLVASLLSGVFLLVAEFVPLWVGAVVMSAGLALSIFLSRDSFPGVRGVLRSSTPR